jgi:Tol biopolymer transport system component
VIVFFSNRDDAGGRMFVQPADRSAPPKVLWPTERPHRSLDVSSDGRHFILIFLDAHAEGFFVLDRSTGEVRTVSEEGAIRSADFHRDGDWIVYSREERPGYANLWLVPFPGPGEPRQITFEGGVQPQWSLDGSEIFYRGPGYFSAITVEKSGGTLVTGRPRPLFEDRFRETYPGTLLNYSQHPTGRFLMIESAQGDSLVLVENWRAKVVQAFARDDGE